MRRGRIDIIYDILKSIQDKGGKIKPTHLLYKSNLSHKRLKLYLDELKAKNLVEEVKVKGKTMISITDQGLEFFKNYKSIKEFTEAFGL